MLAIRQLLVSISPTDESTLRTVVAVGALAGGSRAIETAPASAAYRVGIGEQNARCSTPAWQSLKLKQVRYLVPWDYADHVGQRNEVDHYARARAARQDVLVTFTARRGCYLPSGRYSKARVCRAPARARTATRSACSTRSSW